MALGVQTDEDKLESFEDALSNVEKGFRRLKTTGVIAGATYLLDRFVNSTVDAAVAVQNLSNQTGLFAQNLNRWQMAGQLSDITLSAEQVATQIAGLERNIASIRLGQGDITPFQLLGIDINNKNAFEVLEQVRRAIQGIDDATATNLLEQLGLSANFINLLRLSRKEFDALGEGQFLTEEQLKRVIDMGTALTKLGIVMRQLGDKVVAFFAPAVNKIATAFTNIITGITSATSAIIDSQAAFQAMAGFAAAIALIFKPVTVVIAGLLLLLEDFIVFMRGGDSVIGKIAESISNLLQPLEDRLQRIVDLFKEIPGISKIKSLVEGGYDLSGRLSGLLNRTFFPSSVAPAMSSNVQFNNIYNIQSQEDPTAIADNISKQQQRQLNYTLDDFNNGVVN